MKWVVFLSLLTLSAAAACGGAASSVLYGDGGSSSLFGNDGDAGGSLADGGTSLDSASPSAPDATVASADGGTTPSVDASAAACPGGTTAGTANGLPVCRAPSGIPLFSNVFLILMENTSLSTLQPQLADGGAAPNLGALAAKYATGSDYHGVIHPSLPNYIALVSGDPQGIACDCEAVQNAGACTILCNATINSGSCTCTQNAPSLADQLETAGKTWMAFGEDMGVSTPCNLVTSGNYAVRHVPFLYFDDVQSPLSRCTSHVVDYTLFNPTSPPAFTFIAPNLVDDMHNPFPPDSTNIPNGDKWIGTEVAKILASSAYAAGGLVVVVWDEDDLSGGGPLDTDDPIPIFVLSPYAKNGGYVSGVKANHYSLLATFEDGLGLPRLGSAASATPLVDYFPAQ